MGGRAVLVQAAANVWPAAVVLVASSSVAGWIPRRQGDLKSAWLRDTALWICLAAASGSAVYIGAEVLAAVAVAGLASSAISSGLVTLCLASCAAFATGVGASLCLHRTAWLLGPAAYALGFLAWNGLAAYRVHGPDRVGAVEGMWINAVAGALLAAVGVLTVAVFRRLSRGKGPPPTTAAD